MSAFAEKFEAFLAEELTDWANRHISDFQDLFNALVEKINERHEAGGGWYGFQGPFTHDMGWYGDKWIDAEFKTSVAMVILRDLPEHPASEVLAELRKDAQRLTISGLTSSSSGRFHNVVAQSLGVAAHELIESHFEFVSLEYRANMRAENEVVPEDIKNKLSQASERERELKSRRSGMRSEARIAKIEEEIRDAEAVTAIYRGLREQAIIDAKKEEAVPTTV